jgi:alkyl sulfatase BDS1-like metallo-beta-lactamase superfamily hydrolase
MTDPDFAATDPQEFARKVKAASPAQLAEVMSGDARGRILDEIFSRFPGQFRADRAGATNTVIHWVVTGRPDGGSDTYEVAIADGACTVSATPQQDAKLTVTMSGVDFLNLISGNANPMMMFMTGKLKAKGDLGLAANLANLFDLPKA